MMRGFLGALLALLTGSALGQAPSVEETPGKIVIANAFYRATFVQSRGGFLSEVALADGTPVLGGDLLYTDHGLYPEGHTISSEREPNAEFGLRREAEALVVESRGVLRGDGAYREPERRLAYTMTYACDASPTILVRWSVTPNFSLGKPSGFFSYLIGAPRFAEWFAKTADGVIFQPAGTSSVRCFQSAEEPLDGDDSWLGLLLPDGGIVALSGFRGSPAFGNVFLHESGKGSTGVFCAWFSGPAAADLVAGSPWTGEFRLHLWPRSKQTTVAIPPFLG